MNQVRDIVTKKSKKMSTTKGLANHLQQRRKQLGNDFGILIGKVTRWFLLDQIRRKLMKVYDLLNCKTYLITLKTKKFYRNKKKQRKYLEHQKKIQDKT